MEFRVTIMMENEAFAEYPAAEICGILGDIRAALTSGRLDSTDPADSFMSLRDSNGNIVGSALFSEHRS